MQQTRKIPTILGIILVILLMTGISFLFQFFSKTQTRASTSIEPTAVTVTNVTDTSFTIIWQTEEAANGTLLAVDANGKKYSGFDERDAAGTLGKYTTHSVTMRSVTPATTYDITIISNGKKYPTEEKTYQATTYGALTTTPPNFDPAYGKVVTNDGTPAEGAIVLLTLTNSQQLSTLVRSSGSWIIPLSTVRSFDGTSYLPVEERITETLDVKKEHIESKILTDTLNDSPVPDITLGQQFDFRNLNAKKPASSTIATAVQNETKTAVLGATTGSVILTAPAEGATVSTFRPQVSGVGIAGKKVTISLGLTNPFTGTTTVDKNGLWKYTPTKSLTPGKQRVTISSVDKNNKPIVITHTFTVLKSGTQVLGDATASAELETPTPTLEVVATDTATLASEPMPTSGSLLPTIILLLLGSLLFVGGGSLLFVKK